MRKLFNLLLPTILGRDGIVSARRITAFWFVILVTVDFLGISIIGYMIIFSTQETSIKSIEVLGVLIEVGKVCCIMICILFGITTTQEIFGLKINKEKDDTTS